MKEEELLKLLKESAKERAKEISEKLNAISDTETKNVLVESHKNALEEIRLINEKIKALI